MSNAIQQVLNSMDLRKKIFNFKTEPKKADWEWEINDARDSIIYELDYHITTISYGRYNMPPPVHLTIEEYCDLSKNEYMNMLIDLGCPVPWGILETIKNKKTIIIK